LDDTIYDTKKFKEDIYSVFKPLGIGRAEFIRAYREAAELQRMGYFHYTFEKQVETVRRAGYGAGKRHLIRLNKLFKKNYKKAGTDDFLRFLSNICGKTVLLTAGTVDFQAKKIKAIKVAGLFDQIVQISGGKDKIMRPYARRKNRILFINDNLEENIMIKKKFPKIEVLTLFNPSYWTQDDCVKSKLPWFKNYNQIKKYLTKYESR
jgi:FMN phosphatase YigB (HAD superfamily)